jgi:hypothetical protein
VILLPFGYDRGQIRAKVVCGRFNILNLKKLLFLQIVECFRRDVVRGADADGSAVAVSKHVSHLGIETLLYH